ncbi:hypothetical protein DIPPA_59827 [Diplonema papillatum]|nr:hypothetical protein DIPPA_59827 [Diplonema papillatum]
MKVFLLMGQSNMSGRGELNESRLPLSGVMMWKNNNWLEAVEPLCADPRAAMGLAGEFARLFVDDTKPSHTACIGFIGLAVGGSPLSDWEPGGIHYVTAVETVTAALQASGAPPCELAGILWHQGETDCSEAHLADSWALRFARSMNTFRGTLADLGFLPAQDVLPIIIGQLGTFVAKRENLPFYTIVQEQITKSCAHVSNTSLVAVTGLSDKGDNLHFNSDSLHLLGERYYNAFKQHSSS